MVSMTLYNVWYIGTDFSKVLLKIISVSLHLFHFFDILISIYLYNTCIIYIIWIIWHRYLSHSLFQNTNMFPSWNNKKPQIFVSGSWKLSQNRWFAVFCFLLPRRHFQVPRNFLPGHRWYAGWIGTLRGWGDIFRNLLGWCSRSQMFF